MSIYASQNNQHNFNKEFEEIFSTLKLDKLENYYIIGGDMNAKHTNWNNKENNSRGISLNDWINYNSITYKSKLHYTDASTYPRTNAYLDFFIIDNRIYINPNTQQRLLISNNFTNCQ